jgi:hypothetical protein
MHSHLYIIGKAHGWGTFPKYEAAFSNCLVLGQFFWECSHPRASPYTQWLWKWKPNGGHKNHKFYSLGKKHIGATSPSLALLLALSPFQYDWNLGSPLHGFLTTSPPAPKVFEQSFCFLHPKFLNKVFVGGNGGELLWALPFLGSFEISARVFFHPLKAPARVPLLSSWLKEA